VQIRLSTAAEAYVQIPELALAHVRREQKILPRQDHLPQGHSAPDLVSEVVHHIAGQAHPVRNPLHQADILPGGDKGKSHSLFCQYNPWKKNIFIES